MHVALHLPHVKKKGLFSDIVKFNWEQFVGKIHLKFDLIFK